MNELHCERSFLLEVPSCLQFCGYKICLLTDLEIKLIIYISLYFQWESPKNDLKSKKYWKNTSAMTDY